MGIKGEAKRLTDQLPHDTTWDYTKYEFYVKKKLAKALNEAAIGEIVSHQTAKEQIIPPRTTDN